MERKRAERKKYGEWRGESWEWTGRVLLSEGGFVCESATMSVVDDRSWSRCFYSFIFCRGSVGFRFFDKMSSRAVFHFIRPPPLQWNGFHLWSLQDTRSLFNGLILSEVWATLWFLKFLFWACLIRLSGCNWPLYSSSLRSFFSSPSNPSDCDDLSRAPADQKNRFLVGPVPKKKFDSPCLCIGCVRFRGLQLSYLLGAVAQRS